MFYDKNKRADVATKMNLQNPEEEQAKNKIK